MYPSFFMAHGLPELVTDHNAYTRFLRNLGMKLPKPRGIVIFSSVWESPIQRITGARQLETLKDFISFDDRLGTFQYPAMGDVMLTMRLCDLFEHEGIACETEDSRGLDYGAWAPLSHLYPQGGIPIVAASIHPKLVPEEYYRIGQAIRVLRQQGYMIIGAGGTVYNIARMAWGHAEPENWAWRFDRWLEEQVQVWNLDHLFHYEARAPHAREAVPVMGRFAPLLVSMGASGGKRGIRLLHREYQRGCLSLCCYMFG